jgi:hypothetical protein
LIGAWSGIGRTPGADVLPRMSCETSSSAADEAAFFVEPEAEVELNEAFQWYESRVAGLGGGILLTRSADLWRRKSRAT